MFHLKYIFQDVTLDWTFLYVNKLEQSIVQRARLREGVWFPDAPTGRVTGEFRSHRRSVLLPQQGPFVDELR